jgi:hypothetical protein
MQVAAAVVLCHRYRARGAQPACVSCLIVASWPRADYTYKVCSPTRSSLLSGRYPWRMGYYDMKGPELLPLDTTLLPQLLRGHATAAVGKWNLGSGASRPALNVVSC